MQKPKRKMIEHEHVANILNGAYRNHPDFFRIYTMPGEQGYYLLFEGYDFRTEDQQQLLLNSTLNNLKIHFKNCAFHELVFSQTMELLVFEDCLLDKLNISSGVFGRIDIHHCENIIKQISFNEDSVIALNVHTEVEEIKISGTARSSNSKVILTARLGLLLISNTSHLTIDCSSVITDCRIDNAFYPFEKAVTIKKLAVNSHNFGTLLLTGLFNEICLTGIRSDISLYRLNCLVSVNISNHYKSNSVDKLNIWLNDVYIGNQLNIVDSEAQVTTELNDRENHFIIINELQVVKKTGGINLRATGETPVFINDVSLSDIYFQKDLYWTLHNVFCSRLTFYNFKNAGIGNITGMSSDSFTPLSIPYDEFLNLYLDENSFKRFFTSPGNIVYSESSLTPNMIMYLSDLGKMNFIDSDFSDFTLKFYSTKLNEIFLAGSKLPNKVTIYDGIRYNADKLHQLRIVNYQLKKLHEQQGDLVAANYYFANEMNAYYLSLNWKTNAAEKFPLLLNRISTNHGNSWLKGLLATLLCSIAFYLMFTYTLGYRFTTDTSEAARSNFYNLLSFFPEFINPLHKLDNFSEVIQTGKFSPFSRIVDAIGRIFIAYFVYQLIQAFRKHGKK